MNTRPTNFCTEAPNDDFDAETKSTKSTKSDAEFNFVDSEDLVSDPFPISALPPILQHIATEAAKAARVPVELTAAAAIATASAAIGAGLAMRTGPHRLTHANLFMLAAATSGTGKGRAYELVTRPLLEIERRHLDEWKQMDKPRLEAKLKVAKKAVEALEKKAEKADGLGRAEIAMELETFVRQIDELTQELKEPRWTVADCTREALVDAIGRGSREALASMSPDARGVVDVLAGRYSKGSSDEDIYLSAFSVESFSTTRVGGRETRLTAPCLSVLWMIQPDALAKMFAKPEFGESGLLPRFLVFDSQAEPQLVPENPHVMAPAAVRDWKTLLEELTTAFHESDAEKPQEFTMSPAAAESFRQFENEFIQERRTGGTLADVAAYAARWAENAMRLALVFHACEFGRAAPSECLEPAGARNGMEVMLWFQRQQLAVLQQSREEDLQTLADRIERILKQQPAEEMTLSDLQKRHKVSRSQVEAVVQNFPSRMEIRPRKPDGAGRPGTVVKLKREEPKLSREEIEKRRKMYNSL